MSARRVGIARVYLDSLRAALHLSDEYRIESVRDDHWRGCVELLVFGPECPLVQEGWEIPQISIESTLGPEGDWVTRVVS